MRSSTDAQDDLKDIETPESGSQRSCGFSLHVYPVSIAHSTPGLLRASSTTLMSVVDLSDPSGEQDTCHTVDP